MKYAKYLAILVLAMFLASCENRGPNRDTNNTNNDRSAEDVRNDTKSDIDARKDNAKVEKDEYENKVQAFLDKEDARIDGLKNRLKGESGSAKVRTQREITRMEKDRDAIKTHLDEIKSASAESW